MQLNKIWEGVILWRDLEARSKSWMQVSWKDLIVDEVLPDVSALLCLFPVPSYFLANLIASLEEAAVGG